MRLPLWVRIWIVLGLGGVNLAAFFLTHTPTGYWAAWCAAFIVAVNGPTILIQRGWSRLLALPHLVVWIPLLAYVVYRLGAQDVTDTERVYGSVLLIVNGISVIFDLADAWRWFTGERSVP